VRQDSVPHQRNACCLNSQSKNEGRKMEIWKYGTAFFTVFSKCLYTTLKNRPFYYWQISMQWSSYIAIYMKIISTLVVKGLCIVQMLLATSNSPCHPWHFHWLIFSQYRSWSWSWIMSQFLNCFIGLQGPFSLSISSVILICERTKQSETSYECPLSPAPFAQLHTLRPCSQHFTYNL
jgi:hypothetical protein